MIPIRTTRYDEARRFIALHKAFDLPKDDFPRNSEDAAKHALCDALSYIHGASESLGRICELSDRLLAYRDSVCDGGEPAIYDVKALSRAEGCTFDVALLACRLCGAWIDGDDWRDDGVGHPVLLTFQDWNPHD